jgi:hypothetical protein
MAAKRTLLTAKNGFADPGRTEFSDGRRITICTFVGKSAGIRAAKQTMVT